MQDDTNKPTDTPTQVPASSLPPEAEEKEVMGEVQSLENEEKAEVKEDLTKAENTLQSEKEETGGEEEKPTEDPGIQMQRIKNLQNLMLDQVSMLTDTLGNKGVDELILMHEDISQIVSTAGIEDKVLFEKYLYAAQQAISALATNLSQLTPENKTKIAESELLLGSEIGKTVKTVSET